FFEDLVAGRPMPTQFQTRTLDIDTVVAMALFLHRDIAVHPKTSSVVAGVDLVHRWGDPFYAHVDRDLFRLFRFIQNALATNPKTVSDAIGWVRDFILEDRLPSL